jgi:hypothetical protein
VLVPARARRAHAPARTLEALDRAPPSRCAAAAPLVFLLIEAHGAGVATIAHLIFRSLTATPACGTRSG